MPLKCLCCGEVIKGIDEILIEIKDYYTPCPHCTDPLLNKFQPLKAQVTGSLKKCDCGRRHLDAVMADISMIMISEGLLDSKATLRQAGVPLITPSYVLKSPPFLPEKSLVFLSPEINRDAAEIIMEEVNEVKGVLKGDPRRTVGVKDPTSRTYTYETLAGCDLRCDVIITEAGPLCIYRRQSMMHIELPETLYSKIRAVEKEIASIGEGLRVIDATCGAGTLGIFSLLMGAKRVVFNDIWKYACEMTELNLKINGFKVNRKGSGQSFEIYNSDIGVLTEMTNEKFDLCIVDPFPGADASRFVESAKRLATNVLLIQ